MIYYKNAFKMIYYENALEMIKRKPDISEIIRTYCNYNSVLFFQTRTLNNHPHQNWSGINNGLSRSYHPNMNLDQSKDNQPHPGILEIKRKIGYICIYITKIQISIKKY